MKRKKIGVIGAMNSEVAHLFDAMTDRTAEPVADLTFYRGSIGGNDVIVVRCGVGKVNAARCAQMLIDRYAPDYIINTGIAGGVGDGLRVGDLVVGTELVQHDFDISSFGYAKGYISGIGNGKSASVFRSDAELTKAFLRTVCTFLPENRVHTGRIATGDLFVSDAEAKKRLKNDFSALAVEMEGCAIAQTAWVNDVPFLVVRALSDLADGTAASSFETFERETAELSARVIEAFIQAF